MFCFAFTFCSVAFFILCSRVGQVTVLILSRQLSLPVKSEFTARDVVRLVNLFIFTVLYMIGLSTKNKRIHDMTPNAISSDVSISPTNIAIQLRSNQIITHGEVHSLRYHYVIKFVSEMRQIDGFLLFPPPIKIDPHNITEIFL